MEKIKWISLALFISGLSILLFPDRGKPAIILNEKHGPSAMDLLGLILIISAWVLICFAIIKNWKKIQGIIGNTAVTILLVTYFVSIIGIVYSLRASNDTLLWLFICSAALVNIFFVTLSFTKDLRTSKKH